MRISVLVLALATTPLLAQTSTNRAAAHPATHHATAASTVAGGGCIKVPEISPKIPALPAGSACAKALYTITQHPSFTMDYAAPVVSPLVREVIDPKPQTFSLGYIDTQVGTGPLAQPHKWYTVHYTGYFVDGTKFDSSVDRGEPISFPYGAHKVIEGWDTGFEGMHIGGKRRLYVPFQLAYGENGRQGIPPRSFLVFDVQLIAQSDTQPAEKTPVPRPGPNGAAPQSNGARPGTEPGTTSPAGSTATPPVNPTTPSSSTQPPQPSTTPQPK